MMDFYQSKQIKIGNIATSEVEIRDLIKAWVAISIAFAIVMRSPSLGLNFYYSFIIASLSA